MQEQDEEEEFESGELDSGDEEYMVIHTRSTTAVVNCSEVR